MFFLRGSRVLSFECFRVGLRGCLKVLIRFDAFNIFQYVE